MDRKYTNVMKIADDIIAKSYQLEGCYSKVRNIISRDHAEFFTRTSDELRELGKSIKTEIGQYKKEVTDNMNKSRIELASAKKEIFSLKRKVEDLETDQEFSQMDDSYLSSQEDLLRQTEEMPKKRAKTASMLEEQPRKREKAEKKKSKPADKDEEQSLEAGTSSAEINLEK